MKNPLPKAATTSSGPFGAGSSSHAAGLAVPRLLLSAFGARPPSPIFSLEPRSATLWLRGLFLPPLAAVQKLILEELFSAASLHSSPGLLPGSNLSDKAHHGACC